MLHERRREIIELVKKQRMVKVTELVQRYGLSIETIRRDLEYLESKGFLRRVYGGAVLPSVFSQEPEFTHREVINSAEKQAIARAAAELIDNGDTVIVDVGTTARETVRCMLDKQDLTIITNSLLIAQEAMAGNHIRVILLGGELRTGEMSVSGFLAEENLSNFYANKLIMGLAGITLENGITDFHMGEANLRRLMIQQSEHTIAVADSSKFGVKAMNYICPIDKVDYLVTSNVTPEDTIADYRAQGLHVIVAEKASDG